MDTIIRIKLQKQRLITLEACYEFHKEPSQTALGALLYEHACEMQHAIQDKLHNRGAKKFSLSMSGSQALAFCLFWGITSVDDPFAKVVIYEIISEIDRVGKLGG